MNININNYKLKTDLLGPYFRSALWVQGCMKNCPDCIAQGTHSSDENLLISSRILAGLFALQSDTEGITISGGEPFLQAEALYELVAEIKEIRHDYGVIVYTGMNYHEIVRNGDKQAKKFLETIDILIDGEYKNNMPDERFAVGSGNQNIIRLSERYSLQVIDEFYHRKKKTQKIEICVDKKGVSFTGVPSENSENVLKNLKNSLENPLQEGYYDN